MNPRAELKLTMVDIYAAAQREFRPDGQSTCPCDQTAKPARSAHRLQGLRKVHQLVQ